MDRRSSRVVRSNEPIPAWEPEPPRRASPWRTGLTIIGTLVGAWSIAVAVIWLGCLVSGACR